MMKTILIIDDDEFLGDIIKDHFKDRYTVLLANTGAAGLKQCSLNQVDIVLLDQQLPDGEGTSFCPRILEYNDRAKIIFITGYPNFSDAVEAIKGGAYDYLSKPLELQELDLCVEKALRTIGLERIEQVQNFQAEQEKRKIGERGNFLGLNAVRDMVMLAANATANVLITGETGTGKNVIAKAVHYNGITASGPFISFNCAAVPTTLMESELFGHEKGAFTSAISSRRGVFELADGGTLFLDEIGDMPLELQPKLLSVLDDHKVQRLGGEVSKKVQVRLIAATNVNLEEAVRNKTFRSDLYHRLNVLNIHLQPLRDRKADIKLMAKYFVNEFIKHPQGRIAEEDFTFLERYSWPGNVRELRNVIERAAILQKPPIIHPSVIISASTPSPVRQEQERDLQCLAAVEEDYIRYVVEKMDYNYTHSAQVLNVSLSTLKRRAKAMGFSRPK